MSAAITLPPLNLAAPQPCAVKIQSDLLRDRLPGWGCNLGDTYWVHYGVAWVGHLGVGFWAYWNSGVVALDGTPFEGNVVEWAL